MEAIKTEGEAWVGYLTSMMPRGGEFRSRLRTADRKERESLAWEIVAPWCDLTKDWERKPLLVVAASVARRGIDADGKLGLGTAMTFCFPKGAQDSQAVMYMKKILSSQTTVEVCDNITKVLPLLESRAPKLNYSLLTDELWWFNRDQVLRKWAADFYKKGAGQ